MSVDEPATRPRPLDRVRAEASRVLGKGPGGRVRAFGDGTLYVEAGWGAAALAWFVDFVLVLVVVFGSATAYYATVPDGAAGAGLIALAGLVAVPLLYGLCYRNGRGLGALLTGTRLVRIKDGSRVGLAKGGWAMLIRTLGFVVIVLGVLSGDSMDANQVRVSIDVRATDRLRAAGLLRLRDFQR